MRIKTLSLASFQGIKSLDLDFNGSNASIYGDNATGKTTVANAWNWLIFNQPITGSANFTPKTWGAGEELHNLNHGVEADVLLDDGRVINLGKFYKEIYTKKRGSAQQEFSGHTTDYYIDGVPSKQKDYDALLNGLLGDVKKAQILSRPDYFSEALSWQERRQILLDICGNIADVDVMSSNKELKQLEEYLLKKGTEGQLYTVEEYKKIATAQKTAINKELQAIPARIDEAELAKPDTAGIKEEVADQIGRASCRERV